MEVETLTGDRASALQEAGMPVVVVLDNLRSAYNVGNVFRSAEATRAAGIAACGYTAMPPHVKLQKTARGCDVLVPCEHFDTSAEAVEAMHARGMKVYAVETARGASLYWEATIEFPCAFVLGNEALGIAPGALAMCDGIVSLPALGVKNSINVGNCGAVILFDCVRRYWSRFNAAEGKQS